MEEVPNLFYWTSRGPITLGIFWWCSVVKNVSWMAGYCISKEMEMCTKSSDQAKKERELGIVSIANLAKSAQNNLSTHMDYERESAAVGRSRQIRPSSSRHSARALRPSSLSLVNGIVKAEWNITNETRMTLAVTDLFD